MAVGRHARNAGWLRNACIPDIPPDCYASPRSTHPIERPPAYPHRRSTDSNRIADPFLLFSSASYNIADSVLSQ
jgi:hypothetical protein